MTEPAPASSKPAAATAAREPSIRVIMMPKDTYIDQAGAVEAKRHGADFLVTVAMREVVFHEPVYVGDLVSFYTRLVRIGRTSITLNIEAWAQRYLTPTMEKVTAATFVMVALDGDSRPTAVQAR